MFPVFLVFEYMEQEGHYIHNGPWQAIQNTENTKNSLGKTGNGLRPFLRQSWSAPFFETVLKLDTSRSL
jgi:hypothetical protein